MDLSAKPKLGQREVTLHYVTEWIENKLKELLEVSGIHIYVTLLLWKLGLFCVEANGATKYGEYCDSHIEFWHTRRCPV